MNVWDTVTSNSTLAVQAGNTFYDHLNNPNEQGGEGTVFTGDVLGASNILDITPNDNIVLQASTLSTQLDIVQSNHVLEITGESSGIEI